MGRCRYGQGLKKNAAEFIGNEVLDFSCDTAYSLRLTYLTFMGQQRLYIEMARMSENFGITLRLHV
jgi:hypothetical protein